MIRLYDSSAGQVVDVVPRDEGRLAVYVCGPTVYDLPHLGHGRHALVWDVARRWWTFSGYDVRFVSNITDLDDKIIERADHDQMTEGDIAATYETAWWSALDALGVARPDATPHATAYVREMIELIEELLARGAAYSIDDDGIYFDTACVPDYGLLAGQPLESLRAGARVEVVAEKRSPLDFALWKAAIFGQPSWGASFGPGRPGWHTECVVMSLALLGEDFDLHCGGFDLRFPHHENERAQAVALGRPFARHWAHHGWVMAGEEKMSKSLGNYTSLTDLLASHDPRAYRLLVLRSHYRQPIEVSAATLADAERALARLDGLARRFALPTLAGPSAFARAESTAWSAEGEELRAEVAAALDEDLDTPQALAALFEAVGRAHALADAEDDRAEALAEAVGALLAALGLSLRAGAAEVDQESARLVAARDAARTARNWAAADHYRDELVARGWVVEDGPTGTRLHRA